ncbi:hypothetical protein [Clostridium thermobutyricum]|uniref:hypothetical protein n=1 Tax=Clostridium thermobutyricum TaxID=29372 RepID=UPI0029438DB3|nr:hypothetical protein [Clostridium thermobutyricum]
MLKKVIILLLVVLSIVGLGGYKEDSYYIVKKETMNGTEFIENGVRLEYISNLTVEEEKEKIKEILGSNYNIDEQNNNLYLYGKIHIEIRVWQEGSMVYVCSTVINKDKSILTEDIKEELNKIIDKHSSKYEYFEFYKGSFNGNIDEILKKIESKNAKILKIENGYTGNIKLGKENVNFGLVNYDTGLQLIIGTPVIFTTY